MYLLPERTARSEGDEISVVPAAVQMVVRRYPGSHHKGSGALASAGSGWMGHRRFKPTMADGEHRVPCDH